MPNCFIISIYCVYLGIPCHRLKDKMKYMFSVFVNQYTLKFNIYNKNEKEYYLQILTDVFLLL